MKPPSPSPREFRDPNFVFYMVKRMCRWGGKTCRGGSKKRKIRKRTQRRMPGLLALLRNGCAVDPWARACACNFRGVRAIRATCSRCPKAKPRQPAEQGRKQPSTLARPDPCCFERARARSLYLVGLHLLKKFCTGELRVCKQALYGLGKDDLCERR